MLPLLYLDNNATTKIDPEVYVVMRPWLEDDFGNPSSAYSLGRHASIALTEARTQLASLVEAEQPSEIIFNSCGTEAINTAILSAIALNPDKRHIITSSIEHSATIKLCEYLATRGYEITYLPVDQYGLLDLQKLETAIQPKTAIVSLLWANNETGVLFPVEEIAGITSRKKVLLHLDAVQALGKVKINLQKLGVQYASFSAHKLHAPKGIGALYVNHRSLYAPLFRGSQEESKRAGTQNVASIVAFGKAAQLAQTYLFTSSERISKLRDRFEQTLISTIPGVQRNGIHHPRLPNTTNLLFRGIESETALFFFDKEGLCCSIGSSCSTGSCKASHVLTAMGLSRDDARASLRFSLSRMTTDDEIDKALEIIPRIVAKLRGAKHPFPLDDIKKQQ